MTAFSSALIWFGAGVSIAEIITGTYFAPLGFAKGMAAIVIGHILGCALLFLTGVIGAKTQKTAMETTTLSFGKFGSKFFGLLNAAQLLGWTGIMIYDGSLCANTIINGAKNYSKIAALAIGVLIVIWILAGVRNLDKLNFAAALALFGLTLLLCLEIFGGLILDGEKGATVAKAAAAARTASEGLSFGAAIELSAAMPLSWLPVISDYTKDAKKPVSVSLVGALVYFFVSVWMYAIGMGAAIFTGESSIDIVMLKTGLGAAALVIVVLSTVTTTYLDAYSAGVSWQSVLPREGSKFYAKAVAIFVAVLGTVGAILFNMDNITDFLYLIGSVFAPMTAVLLADFFVLKNDSSNKKFDTKRAAMWLLGFIIYRLFMRLDLVFGCTLPAMAATFVLAIFLSSNAIKRPKGRGETTRNND
ncbi:MAG: putative hydroxymethylpyrimidine transporter CytX [Treponema sp.]|nr:putative hydroxymethylpyrimidine transporter CytX [Treponema sp.]